MSTSTDQARTGSTAASPVESVPASERPGGPPATTGDQTPAKRSLFDRLLRRRSGNDEAAESIEGTIASYPHLMAMRPKEGYVFRSDYYEVDNYVAAILAFFHDDSAEENLVPFWGISRITRGLPPNVTTALVEQVELKSSKWVDSQEATVEKMERMDDQNAENATTRKRRASVKIANDNAQTFADIAKGAVYLNAHMRLFVKAPDIATLDEALQAISSRYTEALSTVRLDTYAGLQRRELSTLFMPNKDKRGKGMGFSSTEFAGSYSLVTQGLVDPDGEYVGSMTGDVNLSAVMPDLTKFDHHVVIADDTINERLRRIRVADMWGSKISQSCLAANSRVVHLVLNDADMNKLGPAMSTITHRVDMAHGDINPFEMFGNEEDELLIFSAHLNKIVLMFEQIYSNSAEAETGAKAALMSQMLRDVLVRFYIDRKMWVDNAEHNRDLIKVVNLPHDAYPRLRRFNAFLNNEMKHIQAQAKDDADARRAMRVIHGTFKGMIESSSDLFNVTTKDSVDSATTGKRVIYDFSKLERRGVGIAMAQLVNVLSFAVESLDKGDVVVIHGAENISKDVKLRRYVESQLRHLYSKGGRVVYVYSSVDKMIKDREFNQFQSANYTILGPMIEEEVAAYEKALGTNLSSELRAQVVIRGEGLNYLHRGYTNTVFAFDPIMGLDRAPGLQGVYNNSMAHDGIIGGDNAMYDPNAESASFDDLSEGSAEMAETLSAAPENDRTRGGATATRMVDDETTPTRVLVPRGARARSDEEG